MVNERLTRLCRRLVSDRLSNLPRVSRRTASLSGFFDFSHNLGWPTPIGRIQPLRDDTLQPKAAGMVENARAVIVRQMLIEPAGVVRFAQ